MCDYSTKLRMNSSFLINYHKYKKREEYYQKEKENIQAL